MEYQPKHLFAIDSVPSRLELARKLGAEPLNFVDDPEGTRRRILEVTQGRGADVVMEVVGLAPALRMAYEIVRPFGTIASVGVHNAEVYLQGMERGEMRGLMRGIDTDFRSGGVCKEY